MQIKHPMPETPRAWLEEIAKAYKDARDAIPFGALVGQRPTPDPAVLLAPAEA